MADNNQMQEGKKVDIFAVPLGEAVSMDPTRDAWERAPLAPHDYYQLKLFKGRDPWVEKKSRDGSSVYYEYAIEGKITEWGKGKDYTDRVVYLRVSTGIRNGTSTALTLLVKLGLKTTGMVNMSHAQLAQSVMKVLDKEPTIVAELDWSAWSQDDQTNVGNTEGDFPIVNGVRQDWLPDSKNKRCNASMKVKKLFSKKEVEAGLAPIVTPVAKASGGATAVPVMEELELE